MSTRPRNSKDAQNDRPTSRKGPAEACFAAEREPAKGEVIGSRFRLLEQVHRGLMGSVWRAFDDVTLAPVAVKLVPAELAPALDAEELAALTRISSHAGLVTLIEHGRHGSWWYQAADWVHGETLESLLGTDRGKAQLAANLGRWMRQLAAALDAHHRAGFVHGDVKPANVLVTYDHVCLIDLVGLRIGASWDSHGALASGCASPEARAGAPADPRDDVYGLAQMAIRLLAATSDVQGGAGTRAQAFLTDSQWEALMRAVDPERERRTASATALAHALWPVSARGAVWRRARAVWGRARHGAALASRGLRRHLRAACNGRRADRRWLAAAAAFASVVVGMSSWQQLGSPGGAGVGEVVEPTLSEPTPAYEDLAPADEPGVDAGLDAGLDAGPDAELGQRPAGDLRRTPQARTELTPGLAALPALSPTGDARAGLRSPSHIALDPAIELVFPLTAIVADILLSKADFDRRRAPWPETLSLLADATGWLSVGDLRQPDDDQAPSRKASSATLASSREGDVGERDADESDTDSATALASSREYASPTSREAETTPSAPAWPQVASPEPTADRGTGGPDTVEGVLLASLTTPDVLAGPASPVLAVVPGVPAVPDVPALPDLPVVPDIPTVPDVPALPDLPVVPDIPAVPDVPALPDLPVVPDIPAVPDVPAIPSLPVLPDVPAVPDVPIVPALGGLLGG